MMANIVVVILIIKRRIDSFSLILKVQKERIPDFTHIEVSIKEKRNSRIPRYISKISEESF